MSLIDLKAFHSTFIPALGRFSEAASSELEHSRPSMAAIRDKAVSFYQYDSVDLRSYLALVSQDGAVSANLKNAAAGLARALDRSVLVSDHSPGLAAGGLSIYFPRPQGRYDDRYDDPNVGLGDPWIRFLKAQMLGRSR